MADHRAEYEGLLSRYMAPLRRLAWSYVDDPAGRDDLFQEIAVALWTAVPRFRGDSTERTWVYRVAHNTVISFAASRRRRDCREQHGEVEREPVAVAPQERDAIERQRRERLWAAVQELEYLASLFTRARDQLRAQQTVICVECEAECRVLRPAGESG